VLQLIRNGLKPHNLQSIWEVFVSWTRILQVKEVLCFSGISKVPFFTCFFPWLWLSLVILEKHISTKL